MVPIIIIGARYRGSTKEEVGDSMWGTMALKTFRKMVKYEVNLESEVNVAFLLETKRRGGGAGRRLNLTVGF